MSESQFGADLRVDGRCTWRLWAPLARAAELVLFDPDGRENGAHAMQPAASGFHQFELNRVDVGQRYGYRLEGRDVRPDPTSRWQPDGVHRPSAAWCPDQFQWTDHDWRGIKLPDLVIYELHVGTFTPEGTFRAIIARLDDLLDLAVTAIELLPLGQFPGERGWGYDGAYWFAVQQSYGGPSELQRLVDACHARGLAVILDVIYNHLGPEGNYVGEFGRLFTDRHHTPWGAAVNFDAPGCNDVRHLVLDNVRYWIRNFHIDGLRLDAVHAIRDDSCPHILTEIKQVALAEAQRVQRPVHVIAESILNDVRLLDPVEQNGYGLDAQWSDDFHHCVHALLTGERQAYYIDYSEPAAQLAKAYNEVFVYDGCFSRFHGRAFGSPARDHSGERFVINVQTHDQVGNRPSGDRFGTLLSPAKQRLAAGLLLLAPYVPLLFMGEEYGETRPFPFFCDFGDAALRAAVERGRRDEFLTAGWMDEPPNPNDLSTFQAAILTWNWRENPRQQRLRSLYRRLLALRKSHPAMRDFRHRSAELLLEPPHQNLLLVKRGDPAKVHECLCACFNLSPRFKSLPSTARESGQLLVDSEQRGLATAPLPPQRLDGLRPFAFAVFGHSCEVP